MSKFVRHKKKDDNHQGNMPDEFIRTGLQACKGCEFTA